uniref:DUF1640 domain-containing protein n=1 Tax=Candidatus Kentrum sp. FW TaxID=2126338 RepID=A0A450T583_9GAMM|nr:MAG: hypothetical protein BECKFW1821A_GA0114235_11154 [Candidatus Kentron sp. FW]VFJ65170.1 MAG: hypothetical protein BECKFW1821B_GA0114236_11014 [Candidatus Kentron sp. FW]
MAAITFDTLKYMERLTDSGIPEPQAKAQAAALGEVLQSQELVTKADLREEVTSLKGEIIKWVVGISFAQLALILTILPRLV